MSMWYVWSVVVGIMEVVWSMRRTPGKRQEGEDTDP
jgi:hypothetical protein